MTRDKAIIPFWGCQYPFQKVYEAIILEPFKISPVRVEY